MKFTLLAMSACHSIGDGGKFPAFKEPWHSYFPVHEQRPIWLLALQPLTYHFGPTLFTKLTIILPGHIGTIKGYQIHTS